MTMVDFEYVKRLEVRIEKLEALHVNEKPYQTLTGDDAKRMQEDIAKVAPPEEIERRKDGLRFVSQPGKYSIERHLKKEDVGNPALARNEFKTVVAFQALMMEKLQKNAHKGGWEDEDVFALRDRMGEELDELDECLTRFPGSNRDEKWRNEVARECADIANFAMMLADVVGGLEK